MTLEPPTYLDILISLWKTVVSITYANTGIPQTFSSLTLDANTIQYIQQSNDIGNKM